MTNANDGGVTRPPNLDLTSNGVLRHAAEAAGVIAPISPDITPEALTALIVDRARELERERSIHLAPAPRDMAEARWRAALGPTYDLLAGDDDLRARVEDELRAASALSLLPGLVLGAALKPVADVYRRLVDYLLPTEIRRPFEKAFGLLVDSALSLSAMATQPLTLDALARLGAPPEAVQLDIDTRAQATMACGETAAAMLLQLSGEPTTLGEVDTQTGIGMGGSFLVDEELRRRNLSIVSGPGDLLTLKRLLASGHPVMVAVGWESGGGHYAVVSGYDDQRGVLQIENWDARGGSHRVRYDEFDAVWARRTRSFTAVVGTRDPRLDALLRARDVRPADVIHRGLSLADLWVTPSGKVYVEGAYRYVTTTTDLTVRLAYDASEKSLDRRLNGSVAFRRQVAPGTWLGLRVEKLSLVGREETWHGFDGTPLGVGLTLEQSGFELRATASSGALQASVAADLGKWVTGLGLAANLSVGADGDVRVTATLSGTA